MASPRVTASEVTEIITTSVDDSDIGACIIAADLIVDTYLANETGMSNDLLKEIERWLAAHLLASSKEVQELSVRVGEAEHRRVGSFGKGLESTTYGQVVLSLDNSGKLKNLTKSKALFSVISESD